MNPRALLSLAIIAAGVFAFRALHFAGYEPRIDQAESARLTKSLQEADHFWPTRVPGDSLREALERDAHSSLGVLAHAMVLKPVVLLTSVHMVLASLVSTVAGASYRSQVLLSIAVSVLTVVTTGLLGWACARTASPGMTGSESSAVALLASSAMGLNVYGHLFSPWGAHNFGVLALVAAATASTIALDKRSMLRFGGHVGWAFGWQVMAIYTHWTNVLLLAPATVIAIAVAPGMAPRRRAVSVGAYALVVVLLLSPLLVLMGIARDTPGVPTISWATGDRGGFGAFTAAAVAERAVDWVSSCATYISPWALIGGLLGLVLLTVNTRVVLPGALLLSHWLAWTLVPGFTWSGSPTRLRTINYVIPLLCLGLAWLALTGWRWLGQPGDLRMPAWLKRVGCVAAFGVCAGYATEQAREGLHLESAAMRRGGFYEEYVQGQGTLRPMVADIDMRMPPNETLYAWDDGLRSLFWVLSRRSVAMPPAVDSYLSHARSGDLQAWSERRGLAKARRPFFMLASTRVPESEIGRGAAVVCAGGGPPQNTGLTVEEIGKYPAPLRYGNEVHLYRVSPKAGPNEADSSRIGD